jgi:hypothetical protein
VDSGLITPGVDSGLITPGVDSGLITERSSIKHSILPS